MVEILPIRLLTEEDAPIFGGLNVSLAKLARSGFPVGPGVVVTPPQFKLRSILEHFDFSTKEVFQQSLTLVKKEIRSIPPPEILTKELGKHKTFFFNGTKIRSIKDLWLALLYSWLDQIKQRIWSNGFYPGISEDLDPQVVIFIKKLESFGVAHFDPLQDDAEIIVRAGELHPNDVKKLTEMVKIANKKLFLSYEYEWIVDDELKLTGVLAYTPPDDVIAASLPETQPSSSPAEVKRSAVKVFFDLSQGLIIENNVDGVYIAAEKIFDPDKPAESFESLVFKVVESAITFSPSPVFVKLADISEGPPGGRAGMGKLRGTLRLLHQKSLLDSLTEALNFARHKKGLTNVHIVIPFVRGVNELLKIKRELAAKKLMRKNSLEFWMEIAVPENIVNLEGYLAVGVDGVVINLDELISYLNGFDYSEENLVFYKSEVEGLLKFLDDGIRTLNKSKIPFIACGSLALSPKVLEFLVEKGVWGVVVEKYEAHSAKDLLNQTEKRVILRRST